MTRKSERKSVNCKEVQRKFVPQLLKQTLKHVQDIRIIVWRSIIAVACISRRLKITTSYRVSDSQRKKDVVACSKPYESRFERQPASIKLSGAGLSLWPESDQVRKRLPYGHKLSSCLEKLLKTIQESVRSKGMDVVLTIYQVKDPDLL
jgi:hypothetical protein